MGNCCWGCLQPLRLSGFTEGFWVPIRGVLVRFQDPWGSAFNIDDRIIFRLLQLGHCDPDAPHATCTARGPNSATQI